MIPNVRDVEANRAGNNFWHADNGIEDTFEEAASGEVAPRCFTSIWIDSFRSDGVCETSVCLLDFKLEGLNRTFRRCNQLIGFRERLLSFFVILFDRLARIIRVRLFDGFRHRLSFCVFLVSCVDLCFDLCLFCVKVAESIGIRVESVSNFFGASFELVGGLRWGVECSLNLATFGCLIRGGDIRPAVLGFIDDGLIEHANRHEFCA